MALTLKGNKTAEQRPSLNNFPEWREAQARLTNLRNKAHQLKEDLRAAENALLQFRKGTIDSIDHQAMAMLGDETPSEASGTADVSAERCAKMRQDLEVIQRAIELQNTRMSMMRGELGKGICEALRPEYIQLVQDVCQAIVALSNAAKAERQFREVLKDEDIPFTGYLRPMAFNVIGELSDPNSRASMYLSEAESYGFIKSKDKVA